MTTKHIVIGWDGADLDVVRELGPSALPNLHALMARGAYARLESVKPFATLPNWITFLTGVNPGQHGVYDFTSRRGYTVRFDGALGRRVNTIFSDLDAQGFACACLGFPGTYPPERLTHGVFMSGWDSPVAFEADRSFVEPRALYDELTQTFGAWRFDDVDEFQEHTDRWFETLIATLVERIAHKTRVFSAVMKKKEWDVFACYFGESDTAAHHLWAHHDPRSPRRPNHVSHALAQGLAKIYCALDQQLGELIGLAGEDAEVTLVSDHGSGGSSDKVLYLNRALAEAGLLRFRKTTMLQQLAQFSKRRALEGLPARLRQTLFRALGATLPSMLESKARFGAIDFEHTQAFSDELNYMPAVYLNLAGREPKGQVLAESVEATTQKVIDALLALRDPWTQRAVVSRVYRAAELFSGPCLTKAPDLILDFNLDDGYSYNLMPSSSAPKGDKAMWRRLQRHEYLGKKGRSLAGSHRSHGLFVACGPQVDVAGEIDATMQDVTVTLLARMGLAAPNNTQGRVLGCVSSAQMSAHVRLDERKLDHKRDDALVASRLRSLGYID